MVSAAYALFLAFALKLQRGEIAVLCITIAGVVSSEMLNTAIEKICDFTQKNFSRQIRIIKDIAAGGVLVAAISAVAVGIFLFLRPALWEFILAVLFTPVYLIVGLLTLAVSWFFIFWGPEKIGKKLFRKHQ